MVSIQFYFETFSFTRQHLYQEDISDFLCKYFQKYCLDFSDITLISAKIGGWAGLAIGASVISVVEIVLFGFYLMRMFYRRCFKIT